jgi:hypothetical protein
MYQIQNGIPGTFSNNRVSDVLMASNPRFSAAASSVLQLDRTRCYAKYGRLSTLRPLSTTPFAPNRESF